LVERNVTGALNSNLMFYRGLADGGALEMTRDEMLAEVWSQDDTLRAETRDWLGAFLLTAYRPLEPAELEAYITFYRSRPGQQLDTALFAAFNRMYEELSYLTGRAVARFMRSRKL
jgi:hypothetical protein